MPSYGERHSQYINIRFATCSDSERVTAYALYQIKDYTTLKLNKTEAYTDNITYKK